MTTITLMDGLNRLSLEQVMQCKYNAGTNGYIKNGKIAQKAFKCLIRGTVSFTECGSCKLREHIDKKDINTGYASDSRHLLYHLYPIKTSKDAWQYNLDQLKKRWDLFTGKKVIAVALDDNSEPFSAIKEYMNGYDCEWVQVINTPKLREVKSFYQLFSQVDGLPGYTFYGHGKGVFRELEKVKGWVSSLYEVMLDYWPLVESLLEKNPVVGMYKRSVAGAFGDGTSAWHYSGSFAWYDNAALFSRNWKVIEQLWYGVESYPSMVFSDSEAGCLFHHIDKQLNMYQPHNWGLVERELVQWREDNRRFLSGANVEGNRQLHTT